MAWHSGLSDRRVSEMARDGLAVPKSFVRQQNPIWTQKTPSVAGSTTAAIAIPELWKPQPLCGQVGQLGQENRVNQKDRGSRRGDRIRRPYLIAAQGMC